MLNDSVETYSMNTRQKAMSPEAWCERQGSEGQKIISKFASLLESRRSTTKQDLQICSEELPVMSDKGFVRVDC